MHPVFAALAAAVTLAAAPRPNVVFIHADDLGWGDLSVQGQTHFRTPRIDALAAQGTRFTDYYAGTAVCAPSRASLLTGLHTGHVSIRGNGDLPLAPGPTLADVLHAAGYRTALVGKWGLGPEGSGSEPQQRGFDEAFGVLHHIHAHRQYTDHLWRNGQRVDVDVGRYVSDLYLDEALAFVERERDAKQPFFLYLALTVPHAELRAPEADVAPFRGKFPEVPYTSAKGDAVFPVHPPWIWREYRSQPAPKATFAGMMTRMDRDVGKLLDALDRAGLAERTLVIFTSDNGPHSESGHDPAFFRSAGPFRGKKRDLYEGGIRVPMIARWPGHVPAGAVDATPWAHWDVLPTLAELAGASPPPQLDGRSAVPLLLGRKALGGDRALYWEMHEPVFHQAVRLGRWKAIRVAPGAPVELYDLQTDPGEQHDVAAAHAAVARKLDRLLRSSRTEPANPAWRLDRAAVSAGPARSESPR